MEVLRRNTDYALRAMVSLTRYYKQKPVPTRDVAHEEDISYHVACKMLQKLHNAGLVESCMGPKGGFRLSRKPSKISLLEVIEAIQGPVRINRCLLGVDACPHQPKCTVSEKLIELQEHVNSYLRGVTLDETLKSKHPGKKNKLELGRAHRHQHARQSLGLSVGKQVSVMRNKLINEMKKVFATDERRVEHALAVLNYAEQIQAVEGGDPLVVKAAAILHDIGIPQAERKYGSSTGKYQEIEGPPIAEEILKRYNITADMVKHICRIIANHHSANGIDTIEFRIVWDADWLVNLPADFANASREKLQEIIDKTFKTRKGRQIAVESFVKKLKTN